MRLFFEGLARLDVCTFATLRDKILFLRERVLYSAIAPGRFSGWVAAGLCFLASFFYGLAEFLQEALCLCALYGETGEAEKSEDAVLQFTVI